MSRKYKEKMSVKKIRGSSSLEYIGSGSSRHVARITGDRYGAKNIGNVVKFSRNKTDRPRNRSESRTFQELENCQYAKWLCPVVEVADDYEWLIMEFADTEIGENKGNEFIQEFVELTQISILDIGDVDDVGRHRNKGMVFIDFPWSDKLDQL